MTPPDGPTDEAAVASDDGRESNADEERGRTDHDRERVSLVVRHAEGETSIRARPGRTLRDVLRENDLSPYTGLTERANCGGRGLCATCGVRIREGPEPNHWHDRLADRFGYPRLSCQIEVREGMVVELDEEKVVWGTRETG